MTSKECKLAIISHAGIKQINRAVYRDLKDFVRELILVIPVQLQLSSGQRIVAEPALPGDPVVVPMELDGHNPRTYFYPQLISWLNNARPDVILLENDPVSRLGLKLSAWARRNKAKIICQSYENLKRDFISTIRHQGLKALFKNQAINILNFIMASRVDALLVVNRDSERIFKSYGYERVFRIPLGYDKKVFFDSDDLRDRCRQKISVPHDTMVIAYFGRLVKQKGVHLLIEALARLKSFSWVLLLDHLHDSQDAYVKELRSRLLGHGLQDRVIYFEADHFEIANYMRAADVAVAPSITTASFKEQYGRAVQESMACGCVTVVSDSGHLQDLVGDKSLVFQEGDIVRLSDILKCLIEEKAKRQDYRKYLKQRAAKFFTTEAQSSELQLLLQALLL
jgi:glycosyltransferase involved in cell wall biosynthesis